jgi:hypothetical protein
MDPYFLNIKASNKNEILQGRYLFKDSINDFV